MFLSKGKKNHNPFSLNVSGKKGYNKSGSRHSVGYGVDYTNLGDLNVYGNKHTYPIKKPIYASTDFINVNRNIFIIGPAIFFT